MEVLGDGVADARVAVAQLRVTQRGGGVQVEQVVPALASSYAVQKSHTNSPGDRERHARRGSALEETVLRTDAPCSSSSGSVETPRAWRPGSIRISTARVPISVNGQRQRGEPRAQPAGQVGAVEGDHRDVVGHAQAVLGQGLVDPHRDPVVEADQRIGAGARAQPGATASYAGATAHGHWTTPASVPARLGQGRRDAAQPVAPCGRLGGRVLPHHVDGAAHPGGEEVLDGHPAPPTSSGSTAGRSLVGVDAVQQHARTPRSASGTCTLDAARVA